MKMEEIDKLPDKCSKCKCNSSDWCTDAAGKQPCWAVFSTLNVREWNKISVKEWARLSNEVK
jgi:hypothetical protein